MRERFVPAILVQGILLHYILSLYFPIVTIAGFTGPVVSVLDGDTIEVLHNHHPQPVRLSGIDCSQKGQAFGN